MSSLTAIYRPARQVALPRKVKEACRVDGHVEEVGLLGVQRAVRAVGGGGEGRTGEGDISRRCPEDGECNIGLTGTVDQAGRDQVDSI